MTMTFTDACGFVMPMGQHKGKSIARIGSNDEGMLYLDWFIDQPFLVGSLRAAVKTYLAHPSVAQRLNTLVYSADED